MELGASDGILTIYQGVLGFCRSASSHELLVQVNIDYLLQMTMDVCRL